MEKNNNPVYSRTDSSKINLPEEEWKKLLSPEVYYIAREKEQSGPGPVSTNTLKK